MMMMFGRSGPPPALKDPILTTVGCGWECGVGGEEEEEAEGGAESHVRGTALIMRRNLSLA